jgi:iron complex outermembrane receptor protein
MRTTTVNRASLLASASVLLGFNVGVASAATAADTAAAAASSESGTTVESLVVTARRRSETLFDVPAPVTAVNGDTIRNFNLTDMKSLMERVPNAVLPKSPDNYVTYIYIRGIQQTDVNAQPNFGVYRNGIYSGGERPSFGSLIDVDRLEVLAGPQAGLYGRDAVGGAINVVYATPKDTLGGYLTTEYGRYDHAEIQGAVNVPVAPNFAVRLAGWFQNQDKGEIYNAALNTYVDRYQHDGLRFSAKAEPTNSLSILWIAEYAENRGPATETYAPNGITNILVKSPPESPGIVYRNTPDVNHNNQIYLSQDAKYKSSMGTFEWLLSYSDYHMHDIEDSDKTGLDPSKGLASSSVLRRKEEVRNFYTEALWFSPDDKPLTVTAGVSYFDQSFHFGRSITTTLDLDYLAPISGLACARYLGDPTCPGVPGGAFPAIGLQSAQFNDPNPNSSIGTRSFSVFGLATYHFTRGLSLTAAVRYTNDREHLDFHQSPSANLTPGSPYIVALYAHTFPAISLVNDYNYDNVSPSVELNYKPAKDINLYALYSTGFRPGGFNTTTTSASLIPYGSESADNLEAGIKTRWLGGRLGINLDGFLMYQHNLLTYQPDPIAPPEFFFYYLNNVGSARTYGIEFSAQAQLTSWWSASADVGWEKAQLTGGASYGATLSGGALEFTRDWTVNIQSNARYPIADGYDVVAGVNYHYETGGFLDITSIPWPEYSDLDATFGLARGGASIVAYVNNAFNDRPPQFVYGNRATTLTQGATYGLRFSFRY